MQPTALNAGRGAFLQPKPGIPDLRPQAAPNPFAPIDVHAQIRALIGTMPPPLTPAQLQAQARGMLDPVVNQITQGVQQRAAYGMKQVGGYADSLANDLAASGPANVSRTFAPAEQATAAANAALADRLSGAGNAQADSLAARLAGINEPGATDPAVAATRQAGTGAGNALYAGGNASLDALIAGHAAADEYAGKLPALARLSGVQQGANVQGTANSDLATQLGSLVSQIPGIVQNLRSAQDTKASNWQSRNDSLYTSLSGQNTTRALAQAATATKDAKASLPSATLSAKYGYIVDSTGNAIPDATGHATLVPGFKWNADGKTTSKIAKAGSAPKVSTALSASNGYLTDTSGNPIERGGKTVPYSPYVKPTKPGADPTAKARTSAIASANTKALSIISGAAKSTKRVVQDPVTGVKTTKTVKSPVGSAAYYQAIHEAEAAIAPIVGPYMTPPEITQFVQRQANAYFGQK